LQIRRSAEEAQAAAVVEEEAGRRGIGRAQPRESLRRRHLDAAAVALAERERDQRALAQHGECTTDHFGVAAGRVVVADGGG